MNPNATFGSKISGLNSGSKVIVATADGKVIMSQNVSENAEAEAITICLLVSSSSRLRKALLKSKTNFKKNDYEKEYTYCHHIVCVLFAAAFAQTEKEYSMIISLQNGSTAIPWGITTSRTSPSPEIRSMQKVMW